MEGNKRGKIFTIPKLMLMYFLHRFSVWLLRLYFILVIWYWSFNPLDYSGWGWITWYVCAIFLALIDMMEKSETGIEKKKSNIKILLLCKSLNEHSREWQYTIIIPD